MNDADSDTITVTLNRDEVKKLLASTKPADQMMCVQFTKEDLMKFSGDQHNESWDWKFDELDKKYPYLIHLYYFYLGLKAYNKKHS